MSLIPAKFTAAVNDTGGHFFPEIHTDRNVMVSKYVTGVNDAGGQLATCVNDTGGNFAAGVSERSMKKTFSKKSRDTLSLSKFF